MGLFSKKTKKLYAFATGKSIPIEEVPDDVFSTKMMGDGIAILPEDGIIYAPCTGKVSMVMDRSKHAVGIEVVDDLELLLHVGLDTVNLMGEGFTVHVQEGDTIEVGDPLISFDQELLKEKGINILSMLIVVDPKNHTIIKWHNDEQLEAKTSCLLEYK